MRFLDAFLCLALSAKIHACDKRLKVLANRLAMRVQARYKPLILKMVAGLNPLATFHVFLVSIPDSFFAMPVEPGTPVARATTA